MAGLGEGKALRAEELLYNQITGVWGRGKWFSWLIGRWTFRSEYIIECTGRDGLATSEGDLLGFWCSGLSTRLETRTKESNMDANVIRWNLPHIAKTNYYENSFYLAIVSLNGWSKHVRTRKMVNYTWTVWSRRKLWWRNHAVLTCKLLVIFEYRGERLIELSSSWFHLNIPLGRSKW